LLLPSQVIPLLWNTLRRHWLCVILI